MFASTFVERSQRFVTAHFDCMLITLAAFSGKCNVTVWRTSVCLSRLLLTLIIERVAHILNVTQQGAACEAASVHFGSTIRRTDILVCEIEIISDLLT